MFSEIGQKSLGTFCGVIGEELGLKKTVIEEVLVEGIFVVTLTLVAFVFEAEFFEDTTGSRVSEEVIGFQLIKLHHFEGIFDDNGSGFSGVSLPPLRE